MTSDSYPARHLSTYLWTKERDDFGGYSAITLSPDGRDFVLLSDRAHIIEGSIFRHGDRIIGVRSREIMPLNIPEALYRTPDEPDKERDPDTEGLARDTQGRLYASLETDNIILRKSLDGRWDRLGGFADIDALPPNRGLEALCIAPDGSVLAIPEVSRNLKTPFSVYRLRDGAGWDIALRITRSHGFVPVGADVGPDGLLYILERGFDGLGFFSRVRRFSLTGGGVEDGEPLLVTRRWQFDNLEGLAVWRAEDGAIRLTMVSDDNFNRFQTTEIVEYALA